LKSGKAVINKDTKNLEKAILGCYIRSTTARSFGNKIKCMEKQKSLKRWKLLRKALGKVNRKAKAGIITKPDAFVFYAPPFNFHLVLRTISFIFAGSIINNLYGHSRTA